MAPKKTTRPATAAKAKKPPGAAAKRATTSRSKPKKPSGPTPAAKQPHVRVTAGRSRRNPVMGSLSRSSATQAGKTAHFEVSYLTSLGQQGADLAAAILQNCERDYTALQQIFGGITPHRLPFVVQVTADASGASHSSCMGTDISVGGKSGGNVDFIRSLLVAEADEVFMANFGHGWDCGASPGEGLSRVLANDFYQGVEPADFVASNVWLNLNPRPNFVDNTDPTDRNYDSIGCAVLFLNWLRFQQNYSWAQIVAGGGATLAETYQSLTGKATGWVDFAAFMSAQFPVGRQYDLTTDNPFPINLTA